LLSVAITRMDFRSAGEALNVNFWGALIAIKYAQAQLSSSGSITLTDKILAHKAQKGAAPSTVFEHMIRGLAVDLAPVRVNAVCQGFTLGDMLSDPELIREQTQHLLIPRGGDPAELAQAYLYLMRGGLHDGPGTGRRWRADAGMREVHDIAHATNRSHGTV
jgi:NAD(P)-dependent dehydrogenase (short-subunit alcohol dehydrogenase family)